MSPTRTKRAGEIARDSKRRGGPRYGGATWRVAEQRDDAERYGKARNEQPPDAMPETQAQANVAIESGGEHEGFGRGEKPRKPKARTKPNPRATKKRAKKRR